MTDAAKFRNTMLAEKVGWSSKTIPEFSAEWVVLSEELYAYILAVLFRPHKEKFSLRRVASS